MNKKALTDLILEWRQRAGEMAENLAAAALHPSRAHAARLDASVGTMRHCANQLEALVVATTPPAERPVNAAPPLGYWTSPAGALWEERYRHIDEGYVVLWSTEGDTVSSTHTLDDLRDWGWAYDPPPAERTVNMGPPNFPAPADSSNVSEGGVIRMEKKTPWREALLKEVAVQAERWKAPRRYRVCLANIATGGLPQRGFVDVTAYTAQDAAYQALVGKNSDTQVVLVEPV